MKRLNVTFLAKVAYKLTGAPVHIMSVPEDAVYKGMVKPGAGGWIVMINPDLLDDSEELGVTFCHELVHIVDRTDAGGLGELTEGEVEDYAQRMYAKLERICRREGATFEKLAIRG